MLQHTLSLPWKTIRRLRSTDWTLLPCHDATGRLRNRLLIRPSPKYPDQTESSGATLCSFFTYSLVNFSYLGERSLVLCHELRKVRTTTWASFRHKRNSCIAEGTEPSLCFFGRILAFCFFQSKIKVGFSLRPNMLAHRVQVIVESYQNSVILATNVSR